MFSPGFRLIVIIAALAVGAWRVYEGRWMGWIFIGAAVVLGYFHFFYGTVWHALRALRRGDSDRAAELIAMIKRPEKLGRSYRAYYHWIKAALHQEEGSVEEARTHLEAAIKAGISSSHDRCLAWCNLAELCAAAGDVDAARGHLGRARAEAHKPSADDEIDRVARLIEAAKLQQGMEGKR
jgi:cbb3-type cytochrome oxidase subunit 3